MLLHISPKKGKKKFGLTNTNKLIRTYQGITGLKTGSTSKAKYCLSATAQRDGISLTAVIMAAPDPKIRFVQAAALLDYGFANCTAFQENPDDITLPPQKISGGITPEIIPRVENHSNTYFVEMNNPISLSARFAIANIYRLRSKRGQSSVLFNIH